MQPAALEDARIPETVSRKALAAGENTANNRAASTVSLTRTGVSGQPATLSQPGSRVGEENGVRYQIPERPGGCFAFLVPDPLFRRTIQPHVLPVTMH